MMATASDIVLVFSAHTTLLNHNATHWPVSPAPAPVSPTHVKIIASNKSSESRNWSSNIQLSSGEYSRAFLDICLHKIPVQWWWPLSSALASTFPSVLTPNSSAEDLKLNLFSKIFPAETWYKIIRGFRVQQVSILTSCCCCQVT